MVDVLRNEKPVYFTFYDYRPTRCFGGWIRRGNRWENMRKSEAVFPVSFIIAH